MHVRRLTTLFARWLRAARPALAACLATGLALPAFAQYNGGITTHPGQVFKGTSNIDSSGIVTSYALAAGNWAGLAYAPDGEQTKTIVNVIKLSILEESPDYISTPFTASVYLKIAYGSSSTDTTVAYQKLAVTYSPGAGVRYNAQNYLKFLNEPYVSVKIDTITAPDSALNLLCLENEMLVTQYFQLGTGLTALTPSITATTPAAGDDGFLVAWSWPAGAGNNYTQLEWSWVETEMRGYYPSLNSLFNHDATRVDLPVNMNSYDIPLLYDGTGYLYYRMRPVNIHANGSRTDGPWSSPDSLAFAGHNDSLNWQVTTSYAEEGKRKSVIQYYDGSLRGRQTVTKDNSTNTTISAETFYDAQGRPAVQVLPAPGLNNNIAYTKGLNLFNAPANNPDGYNNQTQTDNPLKYFDMQPVAATGVSIYATATLDTSTGASQYYSPANREITTGNNAALPDAHGYPYTVTRYTPDATGRIMMQGGVGDSLAIGYGHETKYYYGTAPQEELDGMFGTEVGDNTHYFKNMVQDANGQMSVSYVDMHGRTIGTALAGNAPASVQALDISNSGDYPGQGGSVIQENLLDGTTNTVKGNSLESINSILVPYPTTYSFNYQFAPQVLQLPSCTGTPVYYDYTYTLEISITDESGLTEPIVKHYHNVGGNSSTGSPMLDSAGNTTGGTISFSVQLGQGSYSVRKTLTVSDSALANYEQQYMQVGTGICDSLSHITDSVYTALQTLTGCGVTPPVATCQSCLDSMGTTYSAFRSNYILNLNPSSLPPEAEIHAAYSTDSARCALLNTNVSHALDGIKAQMMADMVPYSGQYAKNPDTVAHYSTGGTMYLKYDIFSTANGTGTPYYQYPLKPGAAAGSTTKDYYYATNGQPDITITPSGDYGILDSTSDPMFEQEFKYSWVQSLLPHHPEYAKLYFAQTSLQQVYNWGDSVTQTVTTYSAAAAGGLTTGIVANDPFFTDPLPYSTSAAAAAMNSFISTAWQGGMNLWQMAYGDAECQNNRACYTSAPASPSSWPGTLSGAAKDSIWQQFNFLYTQVRDSMVAAYINHNIVLADTASLVAQGYMLHFPNSVGQAATQYGWNASGWPASTPVAAQSLPGVNLPAIVKSTYTGACISYVPGWQQTLLQCPAIGSLAAAAQDTLLNRITNRMIAVCQAGANQANQTGVSTVSPPLANGDSSFEQIVYDELDSAGIGRSAACNPYVIAFPKPSGMGPQLAKEYISMLDTCTCKRFAAIQAQAAMAGYGTGGGCASGTAVDSLLVPANTGYSDSGYNAIKSIVFEVGFSADSGFNATIDSTLPPCVATGGLPSLNQYLRATYGDTLTAALYAALSHACPLGTPKFDTVAVACPGTGGGGDTRIKNSAGAATFTYASVTVCDSSYLDSAATYYYQLNAAQPMPDFLGCGFVAAPRCLTCARMTALRNEFIDSFPSADSILQFDTTVTSLSPAVIEWNNLFASFVNYRTGMQHTWLQYAQAASASGCNVNNTGGNPAALQDVICADSLPLNDTTGITTPLPPCQQASNTAVNIATNAYNSQTSVLLAHIDSLYRANALGVAGSEIFTVTDTVKEYHYTLYYYDMAGNLVKTVPPKGARPDFDKSFTDSVEMYKAAGNVLTPAHVMATNYRYNSLNQVTAQNTPDAGTSQFWYDRLGRLAVSQNAKQYAAGNYSYTVYDVIGRITEVGQKPQSTAMAQTISQNDSSLDAWLGGGLTRTQITYTVYDTAYYPTAGTQEIGQRNLRNRVSYTQTLQLQSNAGQWQAATYYTYDVHGNVDTLLQDYNGVAVMQGTGNRFKRTVYQYDLISGKVNMVAYQQGNADQFYHSYEYDAENRLTEVYTSRDSIIWQRDAAYTYYKHGPLSSVTIGQLQAQQLNYSYTIQGWMKGVNTASIGHGVVTATANPAVNPYPAAAPAYGFSLHYYHGEYAAISAQTPAEPEILGAFGGAGPAQPGNLFNGNIAAMAVNIPAVGQPLVYGYGYDQLNRIVGMDAYSGFNTTAGTFAPVSITDYRERATYDPNGNILTYTRNGNSVGGTVAQIDSLAYSYNAGTNRLGSIHDAAGAPHTGMGDIGTQSANNYAYDAIGDLTGNATENIGTAASGASNGDGITWTVYGKIDSISKSTGTGIKYIYDAAGNRISKVVSSGGTNTATVYVRDASGNVVSIYTAGVDSINGGDLTQTEIPVYGSSRVGEIKAATDVQNVASNAITLLGGLAADTSSFTRGNVSYELSNHLGNVLVTVSDKKLPVDINGDHLVDYYNADVVTAQDYFPFGMLEPGRQYNAGSQYRYGFNGQENSDEVGPNMTTAEYWEYDARIGRRWNVDPITAKMPSIGPYTAFFDNPIKFNDPTGAVPSTDVKENKDGSYTVVDAKNDGDNKIYKVDDKMHRTGEVIGQTMKPYDFMYTNDGNGTFHFDKTFGGQGEITFKTSNLTVSGTVTLDKNTKASIKNADLNSLLTWGTNLFLSEVEKHRQEPPAYNNTTVVTFMDELELLKGLSANGAALDFKVSLGLPRYTPIKVADGPFGPILTTLRAAGNIDFGVNMRATKPPVFTTNFYFNNVMKKVGEYNQSQNSGNGYNAGFPYYGEHTYSGSYIYFGDFGDFYKKR